MSDIVDEMGGYMGDGSEFEDAPTEDTPKYRLPKNIKWAKPKILNDPESITDVQSEDTPTPLGGLEQPSGNSQSNATKSLPFMVAPGFYLVGFAKRDTSVLGFGSQEVIVTEPKEPKVFLSLVANEIGKRYPMDEFVIVAISHIGVTDLITTDSSQDTVTPMDKTWGAAWPKQDDRQLEYSELQAIYLDWHDHKRPLSGYIKAIQDYVATAQIQLVSELEGGKQTLYGIVPGSKTSGYKAIEAVPVSVLEHKKQELERLQ